MPPSIRRTLLQAQHTHIDEGRAINPSTTLVAALAIIENPWFGQGYVDDLRPAIRESGPVIGKLLADMLIEATGGAGEQNQIEGYGKASVVGMGGYLEHAQAITHTLFFGNQLRDAVSAKSYLAFTNTRGAAGCSMMIPLMDKDDVGRRSHYQTIHLTVPDAPADDEMVIAFGASIGGTPHHRIGDRYQDIAEMGGDIENPAGVPS